MRAIHDHDELVALCDGDGLCLWAAQGLGGRGRAWAAEDGRALAVAGTAISRRDRIAVHGAAEAVVPLVAEVLREVGPAYRPLGDPRLIDAVVAGVPRLVRGKTFGWMETAPGTVPTVTATVPAPGTAPAITAAVSAPGSAPAITGTASAPSTAPAGTATAPAVPPMPRPPHAPVPAVLPAPTAVADVRWLADGDLAEVAALLDRAHPGSDAKPGVPGVERWAGVRDDAGRLGAVAALAWSAPAIALVAGVAVRPDVQGRGLGRTVCGFVLADALARHGRAALMVDEGNDAAERLYRSLGMTYRTIVAAFVR
jgi:GNAT superfamily N-acetyltransferase